MSLEQYERVLEVADERARRYLAGVDDRPVARGGERGRAAQVPGSEASRPGRGPGEGGRGARGCGRAGPDRARQPALLRLRDRRDAAGRARARIGWPAPGIRSRASTSAARRPRWRRRSPGAGCSSSSACRRTPDSASPPVARWRTSPGSPPGGTRCSGDAGWDVEAKGLQRRPGGAGAGRRARARDDLRGAADARLGSEQRDPDRGGRRGPHGSGGARRGARPGRGAGDRLRAGRRGEHRLLRSRSRAIAEVCERHGAWLHVDGAVGLWAAASPQFDPLTEGLERADSWSTDAHKWLNVPYDCGFIAVKRPGRPARGDGDQRPLPDGGGGRPRLLPVRARVLAARSRLRALRGAPLARPERGRGAGRALLRRWRG